MKPLEALYQLQQVDSRIDTIRKRLDEIADEINQNEAVVKAEAELSAAEENYQHWQTKQKDTELEQGRLKAEAADSEQRMYSGDVTNPRELEDLQHKIAELTTRHDELETNLLQIMERREEGETTVAAARKILKQVRAELADTLGELTHEQQELESELATLLPTVDTIRNGLDTQLLATYDKLRSRSGGLAVVKIVESDTCGACGVEMYMQELRKVKRGEIIQCSTCERILIS